MAPSRAVIALYALNGQMCSKAHTALTAPLVLHHARIYKHAMKKIIISCQMQNEPFLIVIYHSSLVKAGEMVLTKRLKFFFFQSWPLKRRNKDHSAIVNCVGIKFLKPR
jgi:hypothetical protein